MNIKLQLTAGILFIASVSHGFTQTSPLYISDVRGKTRVYQNGGAIFHYTQEVPRTQTVLYVDGVDQVVRQSKSLGTRRTGFEYSLDGNPTGEVWEIQSPTSITYDAAFDGENVYYIGYSGEVYRADKDYNNAELLFDAGPRLTGIAYDSSHGTLWTTHDNSEIASEWQLDGTLVSSINVPAGIGGLAYDPADDTLWKAHSNGRELIQFSKDGAVLSRVGSVPFAIGIEFAMGYPDFDGDGVPDNEDECPDSDLSSDIFVLGESSGVENLIHANGCTLADIVSLVIDDCLADSPKNHGQFTRCVAQSLEALVADGWITEEQKDAFQALVAQSNVAKPNAGGKGNKK